MKSSYLFPALAAIAISIASTGCSLLETIQKPKTPAPAPVETPVTEEPLTSAEQINAMAGDWSIIEVLGENVVINGEDHPKLTITPSSSTPDMVDVIGFNGCNYLNGAWNIKGSSIIPAGEFLSTLKSCPDAPYEYKVNQALSDVASYQFTDPSNITLSSSTGLSVMKLRKRNLAFLNGAWRVTSVDGTPVTSAKVRIVIDIDDNRIHGNAGCNLLNGEIVVNLDKGDGIEFRNLATSRMTCPDIATEQAFLLALENVDTASRGASDDQASLKDSSGRVVISLERMSASQLADEQE